MSDEREHQANSLDHPTRESPLSDLSPEDVLAIKGEQSKLKSWLHDSLAEIKDRFDTLVRQETQSSLYGLDTSTLQDYADGLDEQSRNVVKEYAQRVFDCTAERYCSLSVTKNKSSGHFLDWLENTVLPWTLTTTPGKATRWKAEAEEFLRRSRLPYWEGELYQRLSQSLRPTSSPAPEPEPNEKAFSVPISGGRMTLPRLRPTVRDHLKQVKREFDEALESCVSKSIAECKGPPPLSVENSEGVIVCKMLTGLHHDCDRTVKAGDLAPIIKKRDYQKERWEVVGDGDLFVKCFRPQVIRLVREHLKAYREALPDREPFCNALDQVKQNLLIEHFGAFYFSQAVQSEFDEWEESAWEGGHSPDLKPPEHSRGVSPRRKAPEVLGLVGESGKKESEAKSVPSVGRKLSKRNQDLFDRIGKDHFQIQTNSEIAKRFFKGELKRHFKSPEAFRSALNRVRVTLGLPSSSSVKKSGQV